MTATPAATPRWTASRKAALLCAISRADATIDGACAEHAIAPDELESWRARWTRHGLRGLMPTKPRSQVRP